jgi:hypothetical protein
MAPTESGSPVITITRGLAVGKGWLVDDPSGLPNGIDRCPACFYRLDGLPATGLCPECGNQYDNSDVVLFGYVRPDAPRSPRTILLRLLPVAPMFLLVMGSMRSGWKHLFFMVLFIGSVLYSVIAEALRQHAPLQAWLTPVGCAQRRFNEGSQKPAPPLKPWPALSPPLIQRKNDRLYQVRISGGPGRWPMLRYVIRGYFACSDEQAAALKTQFSIWHPGFEDDDLKLALQQFKKRQK